MGSGATTSSTALLSRRRCILFASTAFGLRGWLILSTLCDHWSMGPRQRRCFLVGGIFRSRRPLSVFADGLCGFWGYHLVNGVALSPEVYSVRVDRFRSSRTVSVGSGATTSSTALLSRRRCILFASTTFGLRGWLILSTLCDHWSMGPRQRRCFLVGGIFRLRQPLSVFADGLCGFWATTLSTALLSRRRCILFALTAFGLRGWYFAMLPSRRMRLPFTFTTRC